MIVKPAGAGSVCHMRLDRRDLHLLVLADRVAALIAEHDDAQRGSEAEAGSDRHRAPGERDVPALAAGTTR